MPISFLALLIAWRAHTCTFPPRARLEPAIIFVSQNKHAYYGLKLGYFSFPSTFHRGHILTNKETAEIQ